jgi:hypothetical protein
MWLATIALFSGAAIALLRYRGGAAQPVAAESDDKRSKSAEIAPIPFGEMNGDDVYNASGVVPLADSRFLFCDNKSNDALFELDLADDGQKKGPLIRRPLQGLAPNSISDMEAMTLTEENGRKFIFATSSFGAKKPKNGGPLKIPPSGLLRVTVNSDDSLSAENMAGFRDWFIQNAPIAASSGVRTPDEAGLNIEGLAWDDERHALLFGLRTPLSSNNPLVIPVGVKDIAGPWTTDNLKMLPPIRLMLDSTAGPQGIRSLEYIDSFDAFLVIVGRALSGGKAPFELYEWKGGRHGKVRQLDVSFAPKMKPEGLTSGTVAGRPVLLFLDDNGGYQILWLDKTRF